MQHVIALQILALKMRRVGRVRQDTHSQAGYSGALRSWLQVQAFDIAMNWPTCANLQALYLKVRNDQAVQSHPGHIPGGNLSL